MDGESAADLYGVLGLARRGGARRTCAARRSGELY